MTTKLPFELSTDSVTNWLQSLSQLNSVNSANQLNKAVKQLRSAQTESSELLDTLILLSPTILFITANVEQSLEVESVKNDSKKSLKIEKLCIQLLRNISLAFCISSENKTLTTDERSQALFYALQFIGHTLCQSACFHQFSSSTLWKKTAELYQVANNEGIFEQEIQHKVKEFKQQPTIKTVIQRNCLFALFNANNFASSQIKELFAIANQHAHLLNLTKTTSATSVFLWDLANPNGQAPYLTNNPYQAAGSTIEIELSQFLAPIQTKAFSSQLEKQVLDAISSRLSAYTKDINAALPSAFIINHLLTGFENITEHLAKIEKLNKIHQFSSEYADEKPVNSMSLEPMEFEKSHLNTKSDLSNPNQQITPSHLAKPVKILKTPNEQFLIAETPPLNCAIGEITLLCSTESPIELGIIRQIKSHTNANSSHILIEKITGAPSFVQINTPAIANNKAILINNKQSSELYIAPCKMPKGIQIISNSEQKYTLNNLVDYSPYYMNYSVS